MASWTSDQITQLIELVEKNPCMYEVQNPEYHNKPKRAKCLENIAEKLKELRPYTTPQDVKTKWTGLRNTYSTERRKQIESIKSGSGSDQIYVPSLWYFEKLSYLNDHIDARKSTSNLNIKNTKGKKMEDSESQEVQEEPPVEEYFLTEEGLLSPVGDCIITFSDTTSESLIVTPSETPVPPVTPVAPATSDPTETATPSSSKRGKKRKLNPEMNMENVDIEAINTLKAVQNTMYNITQSGEEKENRETIFGKMVGVRLQNIKSNKRRLRVCRGIDNLLYDAEMEELDSD